MKTVSTLRSGFTLLEIILVISLIAFAYTVALPNLGVMTETEIANKLGRLNADVRAAYDTSVLTGKTLRLVFHLASGDYWLEENNKEVTYLGDKKVDSDINEDEDRIRNDEFEEKFKKYEELNGEGVKDPKTDKEIKVESPVLKAKDLLRPAKWGRVDSREWGKRTLGDHLIIKDLQAEHHNAPVTLAASGVQAYGAIYFLPSGYVERAYMHIYYRKGDMEPNEDQKPFTFITQPNQGAGSLTDGFEEIDIKKMEE